MLLLLIVFGVVFRAMTPEERTRLFQAALAALRHGKDVATRRCPECEELRDALRARTRRAFVTPALVALNATIFGSMLFGADALSNPETLVAWGGNYGPRTTNGEWWRLVTSMFVHSGALQLLVNVAGLVQIGLILERLVGPLAFAAVYLGAGVFASLVSLSAYPMAASVGASGAIFGLYGLLLASWIWGILRLSVTIPLTILKRIGPAAAGFILYNVANDDLVRAGELTGVVAGFVSGLVLARRLNDCKPPARRVAAAMAATVAIAVASAMRLGGVTDARPEIDRVVAIEDRTAGAYQAAVDRFRSGRITAEALVQLIDRTIMPELQAADARLKALDKVPQEQQPLVAGAEEYLRLRSESWRLRAEGLRKTNKLASGGSEEPVRAPDESMRRRAETEYRASMLTLSKAEGTERASLKALQKIRPIDQR